MLPRLIVECCPAVFTSSASKRTASSRNKSYFAPTPQTEAASLSRSMPIFVFSNDSAPMPPRTNGRNAPVRKW